MSGLVRGARLRNIASFGFTGRPCADYGEGRHNSPVRTDVGLQRRGRGNMHMAGGFPALKAAF
eukprot:890368-Prorocentrum_minimum.AAC.5